MPTRERYVWVCTNRRPDGHPKGSCAEKGSEELYQSLKRAVALDGLGATVRVMSTSCIDLCEHGVAVAVMPDGVLLEKITNDDVSAIVEALRTKGGVASAPLLSHKRLKCLGESSAQDKGEAL